MAYEPKDGSGSMFRNSKDGNESRPDWRGDLMLDGKILEIVAWEKEGKKGTFLSLRVQPKRDAKKDDGAPLPFVKPQQIAMPPQVESDDLPF